MEATPLFSIITVTFNAARTIGRTLDSVDRQTFGDYEHFVVDGASNDGTQALVNASDNPRRALMSEPDHGLYDAMNKGIAHTTGRYLIFLNAGDKFHTTDTLEKIAAAIRENDMPGIVYGQTILVDDNGDYVGERHLRAPENLTLKSFAQGMLVCHQAFIPLRSVAGYYHPKYRFSADYEWCIRCLQHSRHNVGLTDAVLIDYLSEGLTTANRRRSLMERFSIMSYYYGFIPTVFRHIGFLGRWFKNRKRQTIK